jgi:type I restriction enzyme S subunit
MSMGWAKVPLSELTEKDRSITYGVVKPGDEVEGGVAFIRGGDVSQGRIAVDALRTISQQLSQIYKRTLLRGGELLISLVGNPGEVAIAPPSLEGANIARQVGLVALRREVDAQFVMYFLMSPLGRAELFTRTGGAVQQVINLADLKTIYVPMPSTSVQRRIADILSTYDDLIENNRRRMALLEESARLLYREWFVRLRFPGYEHTPIVDGVPQGWEHVRVDKLGAVLTGKTPSTKEADNYGGDIPFIKTPDMHGNAFVLQSETYLTEKGAKSQANKFLPPGALLVSCIGTVGVVSLTSELCQFNQQINAVIPGENLLRYYCYFAFKEMKPRLDAIGGGVTMANVSKGKFESMDLLRPTDALLRNFDEFSSPVFSQIKVLALQNQKLRTARDLLLPRLMSGDMAV